MVWCYSADNTIYKLINIVTKLTMQKTLQRGFTLIELLVVIAIIGILAAVVLTSLSGAQEGAQNSNVKQSLSSARGAAQLSYNNNNFSYDNVCDDGDEVGDMLTDLADGLAFITGTNISGTAGTNPITCNDSPTAYAITAPLLNDNDDYWCVDSSGFQGGRATALGTGVTACQ